MSFKDFTIIIPALNEEENIGELLSFLVKKYSGIQVIVCDDGSKDKTKKIVQSFTSKNKSIRLLKSDDDKIHGICRRVTEGAKEVKTKYLIVMDADFQHPPEKIGEIAKNLDKGWELIIGTRKKVKNWRFDRKLMSQVATWLGKMVLCFKRKKIPKDILSGFFGIKTEIFGWALKSQPQKFELPGYKVLFDLLKILPNDIKIKEVYYIFGQRKRGQSKIKAKHIILFLKSLFK